MTEEHYLTLQEIKDIPNECLPMLVLSDNIRGFFSLGVKIRTKGTYGHMMWLVPGGFASQAWTFKVCSYEHYENHNMKFIYNPDWTVEQRQLLLSAIHADIKKPWYKTLYDFPAIIGQLLGWDWLQYGRAFICSERIIYLRLIDPEADEWLKVDHTPTPTDVNLWTKARGHKYKVKGRYSPD